jgi:acyl carrier protein
MTKEETALEIIAQVSGVDAASISPESELVAHLGIDSPRALQLMVELEDRLEIEIEDEEVANFRTAGDVLAAVRRRS